MNYNFRKASSADIPSIQGMADNVFRHTYKSLITPGQMEYMMEWMYSTDSLKSQMENGHEYHIVSLDGKDIAYVSFRLDKRNDDGSILFHLEKIYVLPEYQADGLGKKLLGHAESKMREYACPNACAYELNVNRDNVAVGFYKKQGLVIDRAGDFAIGDGFYMNDYIMRKEL